MNEEKTNMTTKRLDHLSENQMREYKEVFQLFKQEKENSKNSQMSRQELVDAMRMLGLNPKEEEIQYILNTIDIEGGGQVEFEKFVIMMEKERVPDESEALKLAFCVFDADNTGFIESEELRYAMEFMKIDKNLEEPELQEMFQYLGIDIDRKIPYQEFKTFISANIDLKDVEDHEAGEKEEEDSVDDDTAGEDPGPSQRLIQPPEDDNDEGNKREIEVPVRVEREPSERDPPTHLMTSRV
ncbi:Calmodulin-like protein 3 [Exaiptasia diaphana]|nr:Calmodulin-like protein 3 [Exaiptasia diaphana]